MKDFVRNVLPKVRNCSPQTLNPRAELHLEREIENEKATVVSGDGVGMVTGMENVNDELGAEAESKNDKPRVLKEYPSWGRDSRIWPLVSLPSAWDEEEDDEAGCVTATPPPSPALSPVTRGAPEIRRIRSAVSLVVPSRNARSHRRKPSAFEPRRTESGHIRLPPITLTVMPTGIPPPPPPSLRRCSTSHPDIASLVDNWSQSGPANKTMVYGTSRPHS